jgi:DNA polymerase I-like protein with 3'-5' exonuclease and polymerase domains
MLIQPSLFYPETDWVPPTGGLPDLRGDNPVAVDTETKDMGLQQERGPGWVFGWGHVCGVSVACRDFKAYYPINHPDTECRDADSVVEWLDTLFDSGTPIVFHNGSYDLGWLRWMGLRRFPRVLHDTHAMAVLDDENRRSYSLDNIAKSLGLPGKNKALLEEAAAAYGCRKKSEIGNFIWRMPGRYVGPYAEDDAAQTLEVFKLLSPKLQQAGTWDAYKLEADLIPTFVRMRERGIRVSTDTAEETQGRLRQLRTEGLAELSSKVGYRLDTNVLLSPDALDPIFAAEGIKVPKTPKTDKGSYKSAWLKQQGHWLPTAIQRLRTLDQMAEKFLGIYILGYQHRGRIHADIHQLRDSDEDGGFSGTRSFRLSYSDPPLQQMPAREEELAPLIRGCFLAEERQRWCALDYSQQEPRFAVHFSAECGIIGADEAVAYYMNNDDADFHQMVADMAGIPRKVAKIINLGLMYGMGLKKLAASLNMPMDQAKELITLYHAKVPWVKGLTDLCSRRANDRGFIRLIDGARCHFDTWEPAWRDADMEWSNSLPLEAAHEFWPGKRLKRGGTHKAMNRLIQGSSARQTKMAILECDRAGFLPLIQMHDELDFSFDQETQGQRALEIMRDVMPLRVPMKVDMAWGTTWGEAA